jgi:hypothetical protein
MTARINFVRTGQGGGEERKAAVCVSCLFLSARKQEGRRWPGAVPAAGRMDGTSQEERTQCSGGRPLLSAILQKEPPRRLRLKDSTNPHRQYRVRAGISLTQSLGRLSTPPAHIGRAARKAEGDTGGWSGHRSYKGQDTDPIKARSS